MFKKMYADLSLIKAQLQLIKKYLEPKSKIENGIEVKTCFPNHSIRLTVISFQMNYHDWLKLEQSKEWKAFQKLLLKYQRKCNRKIQQEDQD